MVVDNVKIKVSDRMPERSNPAISAGISISDYQTFTARCPWMNGSIENFNGWFDEKFWATICLKKQKMGVYYKAKDQDAAVLIKKFEYELRENQKMLGYRMKTIY